jgi:hypothetical protein
MAYRDCATSAKIAIGPDDSNCLNLDLWPQPLEGQTRFTARDQQVATIDAYWSAVLQDETLPYQDRIWKSLPHNRVLR